MSDWSQKFNQKMEAKQQARKEARRDYNAYGQSVRLLFDWIDKKVQSIPAIILDRPVMARTDQFGADGDGPIDMIKSLTLRCESRTIEFTPEGINTAYGRGRIRIRHRAKQLHDYLRLYLIADETSSEAYPSNLVWVYNDKGDDQATEGYVVFGAEQFEALIEAAFLE